MRTIIFPVLLGMLVSSASGEAGEWPAIPPEVWAIKQDAGPTAHGAVIIEERVSYGTRETEVHRRIRIFGELGKGAASLPAFNQIFEMEGRTVQPDGSITPFNGSKDLVSASLKIGAWESKKQSLIPPGLTSNCVVDMHYRIGTYLYGNWSEIPILSAYPIQRKVVGIPGRTIMSSALLGLGRFQFEKILSGQFNNYLFKDLPADEAEPYSLPTARERPVVIFFFQPQMLIDAAKQGPAKYWNEVGEKYYKYTYGTRMSFGRAYRDWSKELRAGLEGEPAVKAGTILSRLEEQIQNGSQLTFAEFAAMPKKVAEEKLDGHDLDATVKRKRTSANGMHCIFYQLLVDEGLDPKLLLVADRDQRIFLFDLPNIYQFSDVLIGVTSAAGDLVWFDPSTRFFPAGIVNPDYQGTHGLLVDPKDWKCKPFVMGSQGAKVNRSLYEFDLAFGDEETFAVKARFSGYPEFLQRKKFFSLEAKEQPRKLKEEMESRLKGYTISKVAVEHATDLHRNVIWSLAGEKEAEEGRRRVFAPFPGLPYPMDIPDAWPETRKSPIVIPYCQIFTARSRFKIPKGWALGKDPEFTQSNGFGTVTWKVNRTVDLDSEEEEGEVIFSVEANMMLSAPSSYGAFRTFLAWIESAARRTLSLERKS